MVKKQMVQVGCKDSFCALTSLDYGPLQGLIFATHEVQSMNYKKLVILSFNPDNLSLKVAYDVKMGIIDQYPDIIQ